MGKLKFHETEDKPSVDELHRFVVGLEKRGDLAFFNLGCRTPGAVYKVHMIFLCAHICIGFADADAKLLVTIS